MRGGRDERWRQDLETGVQGMGRGAGCGKPQERDQDRLECDYLGMGTEGQLELGSGYLSLRSLDI